LLAVVPALAGGRWAEAASLSAHDLQVLGRALTFVEPAPAGTLTLAITYAANDAASRSDAEAIAALIGNGLRAGAAVLRPRMVDTAALAEGGFAVVLAAEGAADALLQAASQEQKILCVTADFAAVQAGRCVMAIRSEPRVEILVNHAAAAAAGIEFRAAFRMMVREI
jgi:hypothetical protein